MARQGVGAVPYNARLAAAKQDRKTGHGDEQGQDAFQRFPVFLDCQIPVHKRSRLQART